MCSQVLKQGISGVPLLLAICDSQYVDKKKMKSIGMSIKKTGVHYFEDGICIMPSIPIGHVVTGLKKMEYLNDR